jgi:hypothetical protein
MLLVLVLVAFVAPVAWALTDLFRRPASAFAAAGRNRGIWIGLLIAALAGPFVIGTPILVSLGIAIWYLVAVRPKVAAAQRASPTPPADER